MKNNYPFTDVVRSRDSVMSSGTSGSSVSSRSDRPKNGIRRKFGLTMPSKKHVVEKGDRSKHSRPGAIYHSLLMPPSLPILCCADLVQWLMRNIIGERNTRRCPLQSNDWKDRLLRSVLPQIFQLSPSKYLPPPPAHTHTHLSPSAQTFLHFFAYLMASFPMIQVVKQEEEALIFLLERMTASYIEMGAAIEVQVPVLDSEGSGEVPLVVEVETSRSLSILTKEWTARAR